VKSLLSMLAWTIAVFGLVGFSGNAASAAAAPEKVWTLMVFLNGDNNLDSFGTADMKEMEAVGSNDKMNIIVLRDTSNAKTSTKIYYIEKGGSKVVKDFGSNIDMGDWKTLVDFFKFAKENFPSQHYLVDVWNHGSGWERRNQEDPLTRGISYDDHSGNHITTLQLGEALRGMAALNGGKKIDILGMDACLMEMAEVIYEVKDGVDIVLGSEEVEPGDGWAYDKFLAPLANNPHMGAEELATVLEQEYVKSYSGGSQGTQDAQGSAVSTARLAAANTTFNQFLGRLIELTPLYNKTIERNVRAAQAFYYSQYKDTIHFINLLKNSIEDAQLKALAEQTVAEFKDAVIANFVNGNKLSNSNGFSIWIPTSSLFTSKKTEYAKLGWARDTQWQKFLDEFLFPSKPLLEVTQFSIVEENPDGFIVSGEKLNFAIKIENFSAMEAQNVVAHIVSPAGITPTAGELVIPSLKKGATVVNGLSVVIDSTALPGKYPVKLVLQVPGLGTLESPFVIGVDPEYTVEPYVLESAHNYDNYENETWTIHKEGAQFLRLHFAKFGTEAKFDYVWILDAQDNVIQKIDGKQQPFWSQMVEGDTVKVKLTSDNAVTDWGFSIDSIAY